MTDSNYTSGTEELEVDIYRAPKRINYQKAHIKSYMPMRDKHRDVPNNNQYFTSVRRQFGRDNEESEIDGNGLLKRMNRYDRSIKSSMLIRNRHGYIPNNNEYNIDVRRQFGYKEQGDENTIRVKIPASPLLTAERCFPNVAENCKKDISRPLIEATPVNPYIDKIHLCYGDLTRYKADAVAVSLSSKYLRKCILEVGGKRLQKVYRRKKRESPDQPFRTHGGNLNCQRIYFIPCTGLLSNASDWVFANFVSEAVRLALNDKKCNVKSLALPAIGCGKLQCDTRNVARNLLNTALKELDHRAARNLNVYFIIERDKTYIFNEFQGAFTSLRNVQKYAEPNSQPLNNVVNRFLIGKRPLNPWDNCYQEVVRMFWNTMTKHLCHEIVDIKSIRNDCWQSQYDIMKNEFFGRLHRDTEMRLFHGCSEFAAENIIKTCFDRSYAGQHGTSYGQGVYFSSKASYSHQYTDTNRKGLRHMFLADVLVGNATTGSSDMKVCPSGFDTTTDNSHIFVIYKDTQAFARYLIIYR